MKTSRLQQIIDEFYATSPQQWVSRVAATSATLGALFAAAAANDRLWPAGLIILPVLAFASAVRPDTPNALIVIAIVLVHWLATVDDVSTPWLPVAAVCLLLYHAVIALSASLPVGGALPRNVVAGWARKTTLTGCATLVMWVFVVVLDSRDAPGNGLLTAMAFAIVAGAAVIIRSRSLDARR